MKTYLKSSMIEFLYIIICSAMLFPTSGFANEDTATNNMGFSYAIRKPENQHSNVGYFDLRMNPDQKQTVELEIFNDGEKEVTVELSLNSAKTNSNGVIEYGPSKIKKDASLKHDIKDIVNIPKEVTVAAKSSSIVPLEIMMPSEKYDGYIAGGIQMIRKETEEEKKANEKATGVMNKYAFSIGMLLSENDTVVQPELSFNKVAAGLSNYRNAFVVNFSNTQSVYVNDMSVDVQISKAKSDEVLYETKKEKYRMAPNSMIDFPINLNGERFEVGDYKAHILVKSGENKWEWNEEFEVTSDEADKYNGQDVSLLQERGINWKLVSMIAGGAIVVFAILFVLVRTISTNRKKNKMKNKKRKKKNMSK